LPEAEFHDTDSLGILVIVRDRIHLGFFLLTHPLSGSISPGEMPYKTVVISAGVSSFDEASLSIIEASIQSHRGHKGTIWSARSLSDFQLIDYDLVFSSGFLTAYR
jgi:hypothetical protein